MEMKAVNPLIFILSVALTLSDAYTAPYVCRLSCPRGQVMDTTTCRCFLIAQRRPQINWNPPCPNIFCPLALFPCSSYRTDSRGCKTCECQCPSVVCPSNCLNGAEFTVDRQGCSICTCRSVPPRNICQQQRSCALFCPNGLETDPYGCQICRCKPHRCGGVCRNLCLNGRVHDSNGCPTCTCKING